MLLECFRQIIKRHRRHSIVLNLKVVGKNEAGHNNQEIDATLAIGEPDNEWLHQPCRDRRCSLVQQR